MAGEPLVTEQKKEKGSKNAFLISLVAILGVAVVVLSVALVFVFKNQPLKKESSHRLQSQSPYNIKFAMHDEDVVKNLKQKDVGDVMRSLFF